MKTRRLLRANGIADFVREFPLDGYFFDFAFLEQRTILETNGRKWHDDPADYEHDHEKWSVPGRHGLKLVLATWDKVPRTPGRVSRRASQNPGRMIGLVRRYRGVDGIEVVGATCREARPLRGGASAWPGRLPWPVGRAGVGACEVSAPVASRPASLPTPPGARTQ